MSTENARALVTEMVKRRQRDGDDTGKAAYIEGVHQGLDRRPCAGR